MLMRENAPLCLALELSRPVLRAPCRKLCIIMLPEYMIHRAPVIMQIPALLAPGNYALHHLFFKLLQKTNKKALCRSVKTMLV